MSLLCDRAHRTPAWRSSAFRSRRAMDPRNRDFVRASRRRWRRESIFAETGDVELDRFRDQALHFAHRAADDANAWKVRHVGSIRRGSAFDDREV